MDGLALHTMQDMQDMQDLASILGSSPRARKMAIQVLHRRMTMSSLGLDFVESMLRCLIAGRRESA